MKNSIDAAVIGNKTDQQKLDETLKLSGSWDMIRHTITNEQMALLFRCALAVQARNKAPIEAAQAKEPIKDCQYQCEKDEGEYEKMAAQYLVRIKELEAGQAKEPSEDERVLALEALDPWEDTIARLNDYICKATASAEDAPTKEKRNFYWDCIDEAKQEKKAIELVRDRGYAREWVNTRFTPVEKSRGEIDYKVEWELEREKFQKETLRTGALTEILNKVIDRLDHQGHAPGPWSRGCYSCKLVGEALAIIGGKEG